VRGEKYLNEPRQYAQVYKQGSSWVGKLVVMKILPNYLSFSRYGISVSRRVRMAVVRNRVKRRLREAIKSVYPKQGWDMIFIARPEAATAHYADLEKEISDLLSRARIIRRNNEKSPLGID
jgi:ribonuclease P protein component